MLKTAELPWPAWRLINYTPNAWALEQVHTSTARFNTYCTCRQCGKTETLAALIHEAASRRPDAYGPPMVGVLSYDYTHAEMSIEKWRARLNAAGIPFKQDLQDHIIYLPWNGNAQVRWLSAEAQPYAVAGYTWSDFFIDEAQAVPDTVYQKLRPGLDVRRARLFSFGTPDVIPEQTWFEGLFRRGQMPDQPNYHSFTLPVTRNPWMDEEAIREARESNMTEEAFRMLYLGQWVQLSNKVFRWEDVDNARRAKRLLAPRPGHNYVGGLDLAQTHDYSVLYIMDTDTRDVVWFWRSSRLDYNLVESTVTEACKLFRVSVVMMENNGPGTPVRDHLRKEGVGVWDVTLHNRNKGEIIENLVADMQFGRIGLPEGDNQLPAEMKAYLRKVTPSGKMGYSAPEGFFDDTVMALAYAAEACRQNGTLIVDSYATWGRDSLTEMGRRIA